MPKGPKGEKRPTDVIGAAVKVMKIVTGEIEEDIDGDGTRRILAHLAPQPRWVTSALLQLLERGVVGVPYDRLREMWQEELATAKVAGGGDFTVH